MKAIIISLLFLGIQSKIFTQQGKQYEVIYNGSHVTINGDNLIILMGDNPKMLPPDETIENLRNQLEEDYKEQLERIEYRIKANNISYADYEKQFQQLRREQSFAIGNLNILKEEMTAARLEDQSYLSRLVYILILEERIDDAIELLKEEVLLGKEMIQVQRYILLANAHLYNQSPNEAENTLLALVQKYPYLDSYVSLCDFYVKSSNPQKAIRFLNSYFESPQLAERGNTYLHIYINYFLLKASRQDFSLTYKPVYEEFFYKILEFQQFMGVLTDNESKLIISLANDCLHINRYDLALDILRNNRQIIIDKEPSQVDFLDSLLSEISINLEKQ